jgi:hypothetical protein
VAKLPLDGTARCHALAQAALTPGTIPFTKGLMRDGEWIPSLRKPMRVLIAALSTLTCLTMVSVASAQNDQGVSRLPDVTANPKPTSVPTNPAPDGTGAKLPGITAEQESAIPYRPCTIARGWVNGHLRCYNKN